MKTTRETAIQRARATAFVKQKALRDATAAKVARALDIEPRKAYLAWEAKMAEAAEFVRWLSKQTAPPECALLVAWLVRSQDIAFAAYNPYMQRLAREAASAASGLEAAAAEVADELARMLKDAVASKE